MRKTLIYSQVTAVLELEFFQHLKLLTNIEDVRHKLFTEINQTCVLHTSTSDTWVIQGCLDDIVKAHQLFTAIWNCCCSVKQRKPTDEDLINTQEQQKLKSCLICEDDIEKPDSKKQTSIAEILTETLEDVCVKPTKTQKKREKKTSKNIVSVQSSKKKETAHEKIKEILHSPDVTPNISKFAISLDSTKPVDGSKETYLNMDETQEVKFSNDFLPLNQERYIEIQESQVDTHSMDKSAEKDDQTCASKTYSEEGVCYNVNTNLTSGDNGVIQTKAEDISKSRRLQCHMCEKVFTTRTNLSKHLKSAHLGIRFKCAFADCAKSFSDKSGLLRHCRKAHQSLQCSKCRQLCQSEEQLQTHTATCNEGPFQAVCVICGKTYTSISNLNKHVKSSHTGQKITCDLCRKSYKTLTNLRDHRENHHNLFDCTRCNKRDMRHADFEAHMKEVHGWPFSVVSVDEEKATEPQRNTAVYIRQKRRRHPTNCPRCNKTFSSVSNVNVHVKRVHQRHREMCPKCGQKFSSHDHLKRHLTLVHEHSNYPCNMCHKTFANRLSLSHHQTTEHRSQTLDMTCQCEVCGRTFLYRRNLDRHIQIVHQKLRYKCDRCSRHFGTKYACTEHIKADHQGHRWLCQHCPRMFKLKHKFSEHVTQKHKNNNKEPVTGIPGRDPTENNRVTKDTANAEKHVFKMPSLTEVEIGINVQKAERMTAKNKVDINLKNVTPSDIPAGDISDLSEPQVCESGPLVDHISVEDAADVLLQTDALPEHYVSSDVGFHCQPLPLTPLLNVSKPDLDNNILKSALETHGIIPSSNTNNNTSNTTLVYPPVASTAPIATREEEHFMPLDFHSALNMAVFRTQDLQPSSLQDQMESAVYAMVSPDTPPTASTDLPYAAFTSPDVFSRDFL